MKQIHRWRIEILPVEGFEPLKIMDLNSSKPIIPHSNRAEVEIFRVQPPKFILVMQLNTSNTHINTAV